MFEVTTGFALNASVVDSKEEFRTLHIEAKGHVLWNRRCKNHLEENSSMYLFSE